MRAVLVIGSKHKKVLHENITRAQWVALVNKLPRAVPPSTANIRYLVLHLINSRGQIVDQVSRCLPA